jgi:hypothetical protein
LAASSSDSQNADTDTDADDGNDNSEDIIVPFYDNWLNDTNVYFVGSHNSLYLKDIRDASEAAHIFVLEPNQFNFIQYDESIKLQEG